MTQPGSGSTPTRICRPVRSRRACRWSASRSNCSAASTCRSPNHGCRQPSGSVEMLPRAASSGSSRASTSVRSVGVGEPRRLGPVGVVDAVLDDLVLEAAVGEAVEGHDLETARVERAAQPVGRRRVLGEDAGDGRAQPQPQPEQVGAEMLAYRQREAVELADDRVEVLTGVDVGAVRDVDGLAVGVTQAHGSVPRAAQHGVAHEGVWRPRTDELLGGCGVTGVLGVTGVIGVSGFAGLA